MKHSIIIILFLIILSSIPNIVADDLDKIDSLNIINDEYSNTTFGTFIENLNISSFFLSIGFDVYRQQNVDIIIIILIIVSIIAFIIISSMGIYMGHHFKNIPPTHPENNKIELNNIKHYIKANINQYSYDTIKLTLIEQGHNPDDIDKEYFSIKKDNPDDDYRENL